MNEFDYNLKPNNQGISNRRPVYGIGINDANYVVMQKINGKKTKCLFYGIWSSILQRCYSKNRQARHQTYIDCTVAQEWLLFSKFKAWVEQHNWKGKHLDKDILIPGNKLYSPETCIFVEPEINMLLTDSAAKRGNYPQGVSLKKHNQKYCSQINKYGKVNHIGYYDTVQEAEAVYKKAKSAHIIEIAMKQTDNRLKNGLLLHAKLILL